MTLNIVYEDSDILVLNKPTGISVHKTHPQDLHETVVDFVLEKYPEIKSVGEDPLRPGIVHRLDKETSGLMIVAKNQKAFEYFKNLFQTRQIKKTYLALVHGRPKEKKGRIELPLGKIGTKQTTRLIGKKELKERDAITDYEVIEEFPSYSLLQVYPQTGRTHQIRIHLKSIGHPLVCDPIYGGKKSICPPELGRLFLHAQKLEFKNISGQNLVLEVDPPSELTNFLKSSNISE
ncbi:MAG: RluA family pseudouridine synthase [bacterium]|nr:RluA family pseudouridine synthase [bacterium]